MSYQKFVPLGLPRQSKASEQELADMVFDFVCDAVSRAPEKFQDRYYGPTLAMPLFIQQYIMKSKNKVMYRQPMEVADKGIPMKARLLNFMGYAVIPSYDMSIVLFFPDQAPYNDGAVYRIFLTQLLLK